MNGWNISGSSAEVELEDLLDHTTKRICEIQPRSFGPTFKSLTTHGKIGLDSSTVQSVCKQNFEMNSERKLISDCGVFMTCYAPIQLKGIDSLQYDLSLEGSLVVLLPFATRVFFLCSMLEWGKSENVQRIHASKWVSLILWKPSHLIY